MPSLISALAFLCMVAGLLGLLARGGLLSPSPLVIAAQVLAVALMIWARIAFGLRSFHATAGATAGGLVTTGPYAHVRHPIYTAAVLFSAAGVCAHLGAGNLVLLAVVVAGALARIRTEEQLVTARYPEYRAYARSTRRMIPFVY